MAFLNRLLSLLLGLGLVALSLWAIVSSIVHAIGMTGLPPAYDIVTRALLAASKAVSETTLASPIVLGVCVGLLLIGAALLLLEAQPRPPGRVRLANEPGITWWGDRASIERGLSHMLVARTSVTRARTRLRPGKATWHVTIDATAPPQTRDEVAGQARAVLARLGRTDNAVDLRLHLHQQRRVA